MRARTDTDTGVVSHGGRLGRLVFVGLGAVLAYLMIVPVLYTVVSSLKPLDQMFEFPVRWIPRTLRLRNFYDPFAEKSFGIFFLNSVLVSVTVTACSLLVGSMGGYSLAKFRYRLRGLFFFFVLMILMVPVEVIIVPLAIITRRLGIMDTRLGLILPVMISPMAIFWMRQFLVTLPDDYADAGRIEGLNELGIFLRIVMPLCKPALGALAIFTFMTNWNSLIWPMVVATKESIRTVPVAIVHFQGEFEVIWNELFAMSVASVVPMITVFLILRERLLESMAMVGLKG